MPDDRRTRVLLGAGAVLCIGALLTAAVLGGAAWRAWLAAAALLAGVPAGALLLSAMLRLIPGSWREGLTPPLARLPLLLPLAALAVAPALLAPGLVYGWVEHSGEGAFRHAWLSPVFFAARGIAWFGGLGLLAAALARDPVAKRAATIGVVFIVAAGLPVVDDWLMSLDDGFASSGYGLYVLAIWTGLALALAVAAGAKDARERVRDVLGGVLFASAALWAYLGFMQFFISWSDDLPGPAGWYARRNGAWAVAAWLAIALKTAGFAPLIFGHIRRNPRTLAACALLLALGSVPEMAWLVLPATGAGGAAGGLTTVLYLLAVAGLGLLGAGGILLWRRRRAVTA